MVEIKKDLMLKLVFQTIQIVLKQLLLLQTGAAVIETFNFKQKMRGPDHSSSLDPNEFFNFVKSIRNVEKIIVSKKIRLHLRN